MEFHIAIISHKRPFNVPKIKSVLSGIPENEIYFYVNKGESEDYKKEGAINVIECGENICQARNKAIVDANEMNLPSIQISDDLRGVKRVSLENGKHIVVNTTVVEIINIMVEELKAKNYFYGGVAVTTNRLNYTGEDFSYDKLIVCDMVCIMPSKYNFDESMALKEDYDLTIQQLLEVGGVVRCNQFLCDFPHRDNKGGANTYRNSSTENEATEKLYKKWGNLIKKHPTREGQISLNYEKINQKKNGQQNLFI